MSHQPMQPVSSTIRHSLVSSTLGFLLTIAIPISSIRLWGQSLLWVTVLFIAMLFIGYQASEARFKPFYAGYWRGLTIGYILAVMFILRARAIAGPPQ